MRQLKIVKQLTNREITSLDKYLQEISRLEMISPEDEVLLAQRIRQGDQIALERLTKANLRFVVSVAKQYQNQGMSLPDLINEGNLGLIKAAQRFDETRGFKFISYAVWWIRQSILQALAEQSRIVRLPLNKIGTMNRIGKAYSELEQKLERTPNPDEVASLLDIPDEEVKDSLRNSSKHLSMDAPLLSDEDNTMYDFMRNEEEVTPETELLMESLRQEINHAIKSLSQKEADIIKMFYGLDGYPPMTLDEIGEKFNLTRERVRQIREKAVRKLKHTSRINVLQSYLG
ncbi:MAG: RNA polymerase sigma factor RpoD/SigA [Bacteroidales bacterium]|jgi:RNA polymerase primary sigma factor|nr:RNA polymerase sigma factor RpoD/SigA [Bacteroidales bacterium]